MVHLGRKRAKRLCASLLSFLLIFQILLVEVFFLNQPVLAAEASEAPIALVSEEPVTSGAILKKYVWTFDRKGQEVQVNANVVEIDLHNPHVKLDTMAGTNGQFTKKQSIREMAVETGAVAAVNGDFYNTKAEGVPIGPQIMNSQLLATPPYLPGFYSFAITKDNKPVVDLFTFKGAIKTQDGASYPLGGINKTYYWFEPDGRHSHIDGLFMYTNAWGQVGRSNDGVTYPTEVLVQNNTIVKVAPGNIIGMIAPKDGYILRASGKADEFVRTHMKEGQKLVAEYEVLPQDPQNKYDVRNFKMMLGGHTVMVDEGKPASFSREVSSLAGYRSRTAIGYSRDQRYVYLITVDNYGTSKGMSMSELQYFMIKVGVWKGLNLDGGGSTQMAARPLGDSQAKLMNQTELGSERKVVNGIGVYTRAPKGALKGIAISGERSLFLNEQAAFQIKAYDEYYNPADTTGMEVKWSMSNPIGMMIDSTFKALIAGETKLTVTSGKVQQSVDIEVIGRGQIAKMEIESAKPVLLENAIYKLPVKVTTKKGTTGIVPPELLKWEFIGFKASVEGDRIKVEGIEPDTKMGYIIVRYDGYSTMLAVPIGEYRLWADYEQLTYPITFSGYPDEVSGNASVVWGLPGKLADDRSIFLTYDFTKGSGAKAAYVHFGESGAAVEGEPRFMKMKVMGDNSLNWIRAEVIDGKGKLKRIDISRQINWYSWKTINVDLTEYQLDYPITLKRLYVVSSEQGQDERVALGKIAVDDITFQYRRQTADEPKTLVNLAVNKKSLTVNGKLMTIDQAPVIVKDNTLVPVRFLVDAMGGQITWDNNERKVSVIRGNHLMEMWIDQTDLIVDGERVTAEVAPVIMNQRTMVPLRLIAEKLGWKVNWEPQTQSITLE